MAGFTIMQSSIGPHMFRLKTSNKTSDCSGSEPSSVTAQMDVQDHADVRLADYMLKSQQKHSLRDDFIDWDNCRIR